MFICLSSNKIFMAIPVTRWRWMRMDPWNGAEERMQNLSNRDMDKDLVAIRMEWLKDFNLNYPSSHSHGTENLPASKSSYLSNIAIFIHFPRNHDSVKRSIMGSLSPPQSQNYVHVPPRDKGICGCFQT